MFRGTPICVRIIHGLRADSTVDKIATKVLKKPHLKTVENFRTEIINNLVN